MRGPHATDNAIPPSDLNLCGGGGGRKTGPITICGLAVTVIVDDSKQSVVSRAGWLADERAGSKS